MTETIVTNDVFTPASTNASAPTVETLTGTVAELVGEGKKYKTVEALAASVQYANEHITRLEKEAREKQEKIDAAARAEEVFNKLLNDKQQNAPTLPTSSGMTPEQVTKLINDNLTQFERNKTAEANKKTANDLIVNHFGDQTKAIAFLTSKAAELGLSTQFLAETASRSPSALINLLGINVNNQSALNSVITSSVNTTVTTNTGTPKHGTVEYYQAMYKTDKKKYYTPAIQNEIMAMATKGVYIT